MSSKQNLSILMITLGSGGAEKVISLLLKKLKNDYNVTLILFYNEIHFPIPKEVEVITFLESNTNIPLYLKLSNAISFIFKYSKTLKKRNIKYAVSFLAFPNLLNGIISIFNKNIITVISERGFPSDNTTSKLSLKISKIFYPIFYNKCDKLFSNSVYINKDLKENFGVKIPMEVIYNPIEVPKNTITASELNQNLNTLKIITAGTLNTRKNQILIIKSIKKSIKDYKLTILGEGHLKDFLNTQIVTNNLQSKVVLEGKVKNVNDYLTKNDCFILSSFTEGFPNVLLEAMAIGLPSISTNCLSGPLELLNDNKPVNINDGEFVKAKYGILINNDDDDALKKALDYLHDNPIERERYSQLSLQRAKKYQLESIYEEFNQFIQS